MASFLYASILVRLSIAMPGAMPWIGPMPTPMGLAATAGMSPRPTEAPGLNGIPQELRKRQNIQYPPPDNWCGFVNGVYDDPLSCSIGLTCVNSRSAVGCCTATTGICTALYTTCLDYLDTCDAACQADPAIRQCGALYPYCGTYSFPGATYLYNCGETSAYFKKVEFLNDYYVTAIGSTLASDSTTNPFGFTDSVTLAPNTGSPTSSTPLPFATSSSSSSGGGLSRLAINGIIIGAVLLVAIVFAVIVVICIIRRKRRNKKAAAAPPAYVPPPMQQQAQQPPPKAFGGYASVPQQEQQPQTTEQPVKPQQPQTTSLYAPSTASALSPPQPGSPDPRFSSANATLFSPQSSDSPPPQSYYKPPHSPTVTEVDGTMGNPGIPNTSPHGTPMEVDATMSNPGVPYGVQHGVPSEVDATMGNPGVPAGGQGITHQRLPSGNPSTAEMNGTMNWAGGGAHSGNTGAGAAPWQQQGPYEMDPHSRG